MPSEDTIIPQVTPILTTMTVSPTHAGSVISDTACLSGGLDPSGTITFMLFGPNDNSCGAPCITTSTVMANGNNCYTSDGFTTSSSAPGTYRWIASYSGDVFNTMVSGACNDANESVVVLPAGTSVTGIGMINSPYLGQASFNLSAGPGRRGGTAGMLDYGDPNAGFRFTSVKITSLSIVGDHAHITGTAKLGRRNFVSFVVDVDDVGSPGTDSFTISLSNGYFATGNLVSGSITIK